MAAGRTKTTMLTTAATIVADSPPRRPPNHAPRNAAPNRTMNPVSPPRPAFRTPFRTMAATPMAAPMAISWAAVIGGVADAGRPSLDRGGWRPVRSGSTPGVPSPAAVNPIPPCTRWIPHDAAMPLKCRCGRARHIEPERFSATVGLGWPTRSRPTSRCPNLSHPLRIAQVAPPMETVPPKGYGGTERIISRARRRVDRSRSRRHDIRQRRFDRPGPPCRDRADRDAADGLRWRSRPVLHGDDARGDRSRRRLRRRPFAPRMVEPSPRPGAPGAGREHVPQPAWTIRGPATRCGTRRPGLVAISQNQASTHPDVPWTVIYNGLSLEDAPFDRRRERRPVLRRPGDPREGRRRGDRDRPEGGPSVADRGEGRTDADRAGLLRERVQARSRGRRLRRRVPRRARAGRPGRTPRRELPRC